jgi:hypothetical protein
MFFIDPHYLTRIIPTLLPEAILTLIVISLPPFAKALNYVKLRATAER